MEIGRLLTAMITPFHENGDVNYEMASKLAKAIVDSGSDGLVIGGTTGEAPTISDDEKLKLFSVIKESIGSDHALIAGTTFSRYSFNEFVLDRGNLGILDFFRLKKFAKETFG